MSVEILGEELNLEEKLALAAKEIFSSLSEIPETQPLNVALCGGRSVVGLLEALLKLSKAQSPSLLSRIHFFLIDERIVPISDKESNFGALKERLFDALIEQGAIVPEKLHPITISLDNPAHGCELYLEELNRLGGNFAVVVLGIGEDGHVAGLFPQHPLLSVPGRSFIPFFDSPKPPAARITASRELVTGSRLGILLVLGEGKRKAWGDFNSANVSEAECPAKMVKEMRRCLVVCDLR
jgi:6-phosphogluconolactonase